MRLLRWGVAPYAWTSPQAAASASGLFSLDIPFPPPPSCVILLSAKRHHLHPWEPAAFWFATWEVTECWIGGLRRTIFSETGDDLYAIKHSLTLSFPSLPSRSSIICHIIILFIHSFIWFHWELRGILVPWTGMEPSSHALEGRLLTTGPPRKSLFPPSVWGNNWNCPP